MSTRRGLSSHPQSQKKKKSEGKRRQKLHNQSPELNGWSTILFWSHNKNRSGTLLKKTPPGAATLDNQVGRRKIFAAHFEYHSRVFFFFFLCCCWLSVPSAIHSLTVHRLKRFSEETNCNSHSPIGLCRNCSRKGIHEITFYLTKLSKSCTALSEKCAFFGTFPDSRDLNFIFVRVVARDFAGCIAWGLCGKSCARVVSKWSVLAGNDIVENHHGRRKRIPPRYPLHLNARVCGLARVGCAWHSAFQTLPHRHRFSSSFIFSHNLLFDEHQTAAEDWPDGITDNGRGAIRIDRSLDGGVHQGDLLAILVRVLIGIRFPKKKLEIIKEFAERDWLEEYRMDSGAVHLETESPIVFRQQRTSQWAERNRRQLDEYSGV
jgi:hypothetical protein